MERSPESKSKKYPIIIGLILIASSVIIYKQHLRIDSLTKSNGTLSSSVSKLTSDKTKLAASNTNLSKSYDALITNYDITATAPAIAKSSPQTGDTEATAQPTASLQINKVQVRTRTSFGATDANANDTMRAIQVTMKNLTTKNQTYWVGNFKAITDTGEVITARVYTNDPGTGTFFNTTEVAPNGTVQQYIPFDDKKHIVTLEWTPPGSQPIYLPIPADQT